ncbi:hypothetical protein HDV00_002496 [Rhizophlyctis rosea]|nr:hypothetical protein HDV00_002496 [Rhizophlyctis rosea]
MTLFGRKKTIPPAPADEVQAPNTPGLEISDPVAAHPIANTIPEPPTGHAVAPALDGLPLPQHSTVAPSTGPAVEPASDAHPLPRQATVASSTGATGAPSRSSTISTEAPPRRSDESLEHLPSRNSTVMSSATAASSGPARTSTVMSSNTAVSHGSGSNVYGNPADILLDRAAGWLSFVKNLMYHFDDLSETEKGIAQSSSKASKYWLAPSKDRDLAFTHGGGSIQFLIKALQEQSAGLAQEHEAINKVLAGQTLPTLYALSKEITKKMDGLEDEQRARRKERQKEEERIKGLQEQLKHGLLSARGGTNVPAKKAGDPYLINTAVHHELAEAHRKFTHRSATLAESERTFGTWESHIIAQIRSALLAYTSLAAVKNNHPGIQPLTQAIEAIHPDAEYPAYRQARLPSELLDAQSDRGLDEFISSRPYEGMGDEFVQIEKEGPMQRKSKVLKKWKEAWFVCTKAGWLHEYAERPRWEAGQGLEPVKSIWLRECTLSPLQMPGVRGEEFYLKKKTEPGVFGGGKSVYYKFVTTSLADSQSWHHILQPHVAAVLSINQRTDFTKTGGSVTSPISPLTPADNALSNAAPAAELDDGSLGRRMSRESRASTAHSVSDDEGRFEGVERKETQFGSGPLSTVPHRE